MGDQGKRTIQRFGDPNSEVRCDVIVYDSLEEMDLGCRDVAQKIMLSMDNREIPKVAEKLSGICELEVTSSNPRVIEITMPNATKGLGLAQLAKMYGIAPKNVLAIGDSHNDVGMLEFAGVKVAVGNAEESLKSVAQHIVRKNVEGGFAQAVHELALKG